MAVYPTKWIYGTTVQSGSTATVDADGNRSVVSVDLS